MGCCGGGHHHNIGFGHHGSHGHYGHHSMEGHQHAGSVGQSSSEPTALDLLKERLAKGEITLDEYQQISQVLTS
ncbi:SHOCT domain-containing protein [Alicyclobacillus sp. SO9]|uniref:SHOCT domain-containing protein n=1 Tax=Alicyclobacillus sp. SO9 TaxID=2665646 RepID=UPI0018E6DF9B|nr:SHOCT domain-containing protein [Alicyclobacillus sp. SO9]QQE78432.1 SHOCT domain-containing protein [Alicyclobacillus sp. SO9]